MLSKIYNYYLNTLILKIKNLKPNPNARTEQGYFNPSTKYCGALPCIYRSSWEKAFMIWCENNPRIAKWSSEELTIPYQIREIINGRSVVKHKHYSPDFIIEYVDGRKCLIEIKPYNQSPNKNHTEEQIKANPILYKNMVKWRYALIWCKKNNMEFKVLTEHQLKPKPYSKKKKM